MDTSKILQYSEAFNKFAEHGPGNDPFQRVIEKANDIIQKVISDNKEYYSREYFGGQTFSVQVVDGDPKASIVYITTNPPIQETKGVEKETNTSYFEMELIDKVMPLGVTIKVKN